MALPAMSGSIARRYLVTQAPGQDRDDELQGQRDDATSKIVDTVEREQREISCNGVIEMVMSNQLHREKNRIIPLLTDEHIVDPRSAGYRHWEVVLVVMLLFTATVTPFEVSFVETQPTDVLFWVNRIVDMGFMVDIIICFNMGFFEVDAPNVLIVDRRKIIIRYVKGWLFIDALAILPLEVLDSSLKIVRVLRLLRLAKLIKIMKSAEIIAQWQLRTGLPYSLSSLGMAAGIALFAVHWMSCAWFLLTKFGNTGDPDDPTWAEAYYLDQSGEFKPQEDLPTSYLYEIALYHGMMTLSTIGYGDVIPSQQQERWMSAIFMQLFGAGLYAYIIAVATGILAAMNAFSLRCDELVDIMNDFATDACVPEELTIRSREYLEYSRRALRQDGWMKLIERLPNALHRQVMSESVMKFVDTHPFLQTLPRGMRVRMAGYLQPCPFPAGEVILPVDEACRCLYFISVGTCRLNNKILGHGCCFGEEIFTQSQLVRNEVKALTDTTCLVVTASQWEKLKSSYPETHSAIRKFAVRFVFQRDVLTTIRQMMPQAFNKHGMLLPNFREILYGSQAAYSVWEKRHQNTRRAKEELENFSGLQRQLLDKDLALKALLNMQHLLSNQVRRQQDKLRHVLKKSAGDDSIALCMNAELNVDVDVSSIIKAQHRITSVNPTLISTTEDTYIESRSNLESFSIVTERIKQFKHLEYHCKYHDNG